MHHSLHSRLLRRYFVPHWPRAVAVGVLLLAGSFLQLLTPQIARYFIDTAQLGGAMGTLVLAAGLFLLVALLSQAVTVVETYLAESLGWAATNTLRADLAEHVLELDLSFHNAHTPGELLERVDGDVTELANFFSRFVLQVLGSTVLLIGVLGLLLYEEWRIGLALLGMSILALVVLSRLHPLGSRAARRSRQAKAELFGFLEERLAGVADIQANGAQPYTLEQLQPLQRDLLLRTRATWSVGNLIGVLAGLVFMFGWVVVFALGAAYYSAGALTIGTVYLLFQYTAMLGQPLGELTEQARDFQRASASVARINELLATTTRVIDGPGTPLPAGPLAVQFEGVSFGYGRVGLPAVEGIGFTVRPGTVLGMLGRTGSGKTTLTRLLFRLYDPDAGSVRLSGVDVRDVRLAELHRRLAIVTQEVQLFHASVRENLALFDPAIGDEQILALIDEIGLTAWYRGLPAGLDTELAPGSGGLSAGEAQLLAFARVLLREPDVVILDEASSRLDPATERLIERAIGRLFAGRTGIVIAHRLETLARVDDILVMQEGRIAEFGPREQLANDTQSRFHELLRASEGPTALPGRPGQHAAGDSVKEDPHVVRFA